MCEQLAQRYYSKAGRQPLSVREHVFTVFFRFQKTRFYVFKVTFQKRHKVVSGSLIEVSSQLRFGFTVFFLSLCKLLPVFIAMVNKLFMAE